jgi:lipoate-protein ligase A
VADNDLTNNGDRMDDPAAADGSGGGHLGGEGDEASILRLLDDGTSRGAVNMARDEALLVRVGVGESPPTLRLYQWDPPTISLGYFQKYAEVEALPEPLCHLDVVRRQTGGGAILHDLELTYSISLPFAHPLLQAGPNHLYEQAHAAVREALREIDTVAEPSGFTDDSTPTRGPFFCFARRHKYDLVVGADKIAGSAQRRTREAVLQHGSIVLGNRYTEQPTATVQQPFVEAVARLRVAFAAAFARLTGLQLIPGSWSAQEEATSKELEPKYAGLEWTRKS